MSVRLNRRLQRAVNLLGDTVNNIDAEIFTVLYRGAQSIVAGAKQRVHIDTAALFDSIRLEVVSQSPPHIRVIAGGINVNPKTGRIVDYAVAHEADYPYMQPAIDSVSPQIRTALVTILEKHYEEINND